MRKFIVLVQKEIKELLTWQMIVPFVAVVVIFALIGNFMGKESEKSQNEKQTIAFLDLDQTPASKNISTLLNQSNIIVKDYSGTPLDNFMQTIKNDGLNAGIAIPKGFEKQIQNHEHVNILTFTPIKNFSILSFKDTATLTASVALINQNISDSWMSSYAPTADPSLIKNPVVPTNTVSVKNKEVQADVSQIMSFVTSQTTFIPIILFLVIVLAAQMIATAVATEKENKTLETLLSTPVDRKIIVSAKMVAAAIVALLMAGIYMFGFSRYMTGITSSATAGASSILPGGDTTELARQLGLTFTTGNYVLLGTTLFFGILVALAIAMILGAFAEDAKAAQGVIAPLMILVLIPYFLTMFIDINSASTVVKYFIYLIPFSHTFLAAPNILLGNTQFVYFGIAYQILLFIIFILIAAKIFSSDYIMTMKLNFGKKK